MSQSHLREGVSTETGRTLRNSGFISLVVTRPTCPQLPNFQIFALSSRASRSKIHLTAFNSSISIILVKVKAYYLNLTASLGASPKLLGSRDEYIYWQSDVG